MFQDKKLIAFCHINKNQLKKQFKNSHLYVINTLKYPENKTFVKSTLKQSSEHTGVEQ